MARGHIIDVSPGGLLTIWSSTHGRYRFFSAPLADLKLLDGLSVEFEPTTSRDLSKISIVYGERAAQNMQTRSMFAFMSRIGELINGSPNQPDGAATFPNAVPQNSVMVGAPSVSSSVELNRGDAVTLNRLIALLER
jgi:hypothetical protein